MKKTMLAFTALALFSAVAFASQSSTAAQTLNIQMRSAMRTRTVVTPRPTTTPFPEAGSSATSYQFHEDVLNLVNEERAKRNLGSLSKNDTLARAAQLYAEQMANSNFFSHIGHDGSTFVQRNKAAGYTDYRWMGENIAAGQKTPQEVMNGWMNSEGHRKNILYPSAKEIGVGYYFKPGSKYSRYWVQEFGHR